MMNDIHILYIDDVVDTDISAFIDEKYNNKNYNYNGKNVRVHYDEIKYDENYNYERLLKDELVNNANVILIDNKLFQERIRSNDRFTGIQFKIIMKKLSPFQEVLIITQNDTPKDFNIIHKNPGTEDINAYDYYLSNLDPSLKEAINSVLEYEDFAAELKSNEGIEKTLVDKILNSLNGDNSYDLLSKKDIDILISKFQEIKNECSK